ncbi:MAG TPA: hypothetical protein VEF89_18295 [Solirubrobacteraceae bacterium]|nr:hypothetical protein [Solirubrobacteraceae bacterium]
MFDRAGGSGKSLLRGDELRGAVERVRVRQVGIHLPAQKELLPGLRSL